MRIKRFHESLKKLDNITKMYIPISDQDAIDIDRILDIARDENISVSVKKLGRSIEGDAPIKNCSYICFHGMGEDVDEKFVSDETYYRVLKEINNRLQDYGFENKFLSGHEADLPLYTMFTRKKVDIDSFNEAYTSIDSDESHDIIQILRNVKDEG